MRSCSVEALVDCRDACGNELRLRAVKITAYRGVTDLLGRHVLGIREPSERPRLIGHQAERAHDVHSNVHVFVQALRRACLL